MYSILDDLAFVCFPSTRQTAVAGVEKLYLDPLCIVDELPLSALRQAPTGWRKRDNSRFGGDGLLNGKPLLVLSWDPAVSGSRSWSTVFTHELTAEISA